MTNLRKLTTAFLLSATLLLSGCAEEEPISVPSADTDMNTSSDVSDSNFSESTETLSESSRSSDSSASTVSKSSTTEISNSVSEPESSSEGSSDVSVGAVPVEFTEEDRKLHEILEDLRKGCVAIDNWVTSDEPYIFNTEMDSDGSLVGYCRVDPNEPGIELFFSEGGSATYYLIPDNYSESGIPFPQTYEDAQEIVLEYYSGRVADNIMDFWVGKGSMTEKSDGTLEVTLDENCSRNWYKLLEIDGKMYRCSGLGGRGLDINPINPASAKIVSKTDDTIEFTYVTAYWYDTDEEGNPKYIDDVSLYEGNAHIGVLKYERGGWRRDWDKDDPRRD